VPCTGYTYCGGIGKPRKSFSGNRKAGRMLELLGYRVAKRVTDKAVAAGCGVHRWDGFVMHDDWCVDRVVSAIRSAAQVPGESPVAAALEATSAQQERWARSAVRKREQEEAEAARRLKEEAAISHLQAELVALRAIYSGMSLLAAVEYVTSDPGHRIALYRRCDAEDPRTSGMEQDDVGHLSISSSAAKDLALLQRRARAEGFQG
jgi:hypothetical protein